MSEVKGAKLKKSPVIKEITATQDRHIFLSWSKVDGAEKYGVKRSTDPAGEFELVKWVKKTQYTDEDVAENVTYWYQIVAWKQLEGKKTSQKSSGARAVVLSDIPAPKNIELTCGKKAEITISWEKGEGTLGCIISRRNDFHNRLVPVATESKTFKDTAIVTGQPYHYCLQYYKKEGENLLHGNFSEEFDCIHLDSGKILSAKKVPFGKVSLSLRLVAGAGGYIVYRSETEKGEYTEVMRSKDGFDLKLKCKAPQAFKAYYYKVASFRVLGDKEFVSVMSAPVRV